MMKRAIILSLGLMSAWILPACGFTPMHAPATNAAQKTALKNIHIQVIDPEDIAHDEGAYWLEQSLYDRLGTGGTGDTLELRPTYQRPGIAISSSDVATRFDMVVNVNYRLLEAGSGDVLDRGTVTAVTTFLSSPDPYSRTTAEKNAMQNVSRDAADRLIVRVAAHYAK